MHTFETLELATPRLLLRPPEPRDAQALLRVFGDPAVMRYWATPPWAGLDDAHRFIDRSRAGNAEGDALRLLLVPRSEDIAAAPIGQCTLFDIDRDNRRAEIGYSMAADHWGRGLMHEALRALVRYGFEAIGLNRIEADIDPRNAASARSLERLGFRREGLLRERWIVAGEVSDTALYGLLASDWRASNPAPGAANPDRPAAP